MALPDIPDVFQSVESIVIARFAATKVLLRGNKGFMRLAGDQSGNGWGLFTQPHLDLVTESTPTADGLAYEGLLTLTSELAGTQTLSGKVYVAAGETLVVAGYDIDEFERISVEMYELNSSLEIAQRELIHLNRELVKRETIIQALSLKDILTGIGNRRYLDETLATESLRAARYDQPLSLIMADIDHFKRVNDTWGHEAGDYVLREFGALLREFLRQSDSAARFGGEEFVLLMPGTSMAQAETAAERLRQEVAARDMGKAQAITASFGVACLGFGESAASLLARADGALYSAKKRGRNCVVSATEYKPSANEKVHE